MMKPSFVLGFVILFVVEAGAVLAEDPVIAPAMDAPALVERAIASGAFGAVEVARRETTAGIIVGDADVTNRLFLVEPGRELKLRAVFLEESDSAGPESGARILEDVGFYRQTSYREIVWETEAEDHLVDGGGGWVVWRPGTARSRTSVVTATLASLEVDRAARSAASPEDAAPAVLRTGKASVFVLGGVMYDRNGDGILLGQNIGIYPNESGPSAPDSVSSRAQTYRPPTVFYRLDERARECHVTPGLRLGDIAPPVFPTSEPEDGRLIAVSPRLLRFLEAFEQELASSGYRPGQLGILRGFVSPSEKQRLERQNVFLAEFTRFQYGDALAITLDPKADPEVSSPGGRRMGDLDGDGKISAADGAILARLAKKTMDELGMYGGIEMVPAFEGPGEAKGTPYVHVDLRGWYVPLSDF